MDLKQWYNDKGSSYGRQVAQRQARNKWYIAGELLSAAWAVTAAVLWAMHPINSWWGILVVLGVVGWVVISRIDVANTLHINRLAALQRACLAESDYLEGNYKNFEQGMAYADVHHIYSFDLDIFGPSSLFNRVCRCVSTGGRTQLAKYLCRLCWEPDRPAALHEMARKDVFLLTFKAGAYNKEGVIDTERLAEAVAQMKTVKVPHYLMTTWLLVLAWVGGLGLLTSLGMAICGVLNWSVPVWWATLQFFVVYACCAKPLRWLGKVATPLSDSLKGYASLVALLQQTPFETELNRKLQQQLKGADVSFMQLQRLLQGLDSRGNVIGLMLFDAFLLYDIFLVRRFGRWQQQCMADIGKWMEVLARFDALVSMATMWRNHPEGAEAEIVPGNEVEYKAEGLYHPFLGRKARKNDFYIAEGQYHIITGANMAGKSTFLRAVGINYVLAINGLPVCADHMRVTNFQLFSSMRTQDDLTLGISYFNAELLRLKQLVDYVQASQRPTLIILDEILKGTNSADKLNGSRMFLQAMMQLPVTGVIATHDLELSRMADEYPNRMYNYCFEIQMAEQVTYDYRMTKGVAHHQNATFLLRKMLKTCHLDV